MNFLTIKIPYTSKNSDFLINNFLYNSGSLNYKHQIDDMSISDGQGACWIFYYIFPERTRDSYMRLMVHVKAF